MTGRPLTQTERCRSRRGGDRCDRPVHAPEQLHRSETLDGAGRPQIHQWRDPR
jgi:hypothetical protein